jgi:hypothetical protein
VADQSIKKDLHRLTLSPALATPGLPERVAALEIGLKRGIGLPNYVSRAPSSSTHVEVISVYSHILVTEAGAWEVPQGFPDSGDYINGSTFDLLEPHYMQRRVHAVWYDTGGANLLETRFMVRLEQPYSALINTLEEGGILGEVLYGIDFIDSGKPLILNKVEQLRSLLGI